MKDLENALVEPQKSNRKNGRDGNGDKHHAELVVPRAVRCDCAHFDSRQLNLPFAYLRQVLIAGKGRVLLALPLGVVSWKETAITLISF